MPTPLHTARPKPIADHIFAERESLLRILYEHSDIGRLSTDLADCIAARVRLDEILAGPVITSRSGRSVELVLHEDGPLLETLTVLRRLDGGHMAVVWGLLDCGTRADHPVTGAHDGLLRLAHELVDRLDGAS